jgi:hypothetical protein
VLGVLDPSASGVRGARAGDGWEGVSSGAWDDMVKSRKGLDQLLPGRKGRDRGARLLLRRERRGRRVMQGLVAARTTAEDLCVCLCSSDRYRCRCERERERERERFKVW